MTDNPAIPAASLIVMRDRAEAAPEFLIVKRAAGLAFAGGAFAFPGGRIDPEDHAHAARLSGHPPDEAAARIAAIRETWEETGLAIGSDPATVARGATLDVSGLVPFARWRPGDVAHRRFDTRFYLVQAPADATLGADGQEIVDLFWASAAEVLARCDAGAGRVLFPTRRLLERLALLPDHAAARAQAEALPQIVITPTIETRADGDWLRIPADAGYPVTEERTDSALRT